MLPWSDWVVPAALRNRRDGDEGEDFHHFTARSTTRTMLSENTARMGDEGKAVKRGSADGFAVCAAMVR